MGNPIYLAQSESLSAEWLVLYERSSKWNKEIKKQLLQRLCQHCKKLLYTLELLIETNFSRRSSKTHIFRTAATTLFLIQNGLLCKTRDLLWTWISILEAPVHSLHDTAVNSRYLIYIPLLIPRVTHSHISIAQLFPFHQFYTHHRDMLSNKVIDTLRNESYIWAQRAPEQELAHICTLNGKQNE